MTEVADKLHVAVTTLQVSREKLPFQALLFLAASISDDCFNACVTVLKSAMLSDEDRQNTSAWIALEGLGHPCWRISMMLVHCLRSFLETIVSTSIKLHYQSGTITLDDYTSLVLCDRYLPMVTIQVEVEDAVEAKEKLGHYDAWTVTHDADSHPVLIEAEFADTFEALFNMSLPDWQNFLTMSASDAVFHQGLNTLSRFAQFGVMDWPLQILAHQLKEAHLSLERRIWLSGLESVLQFSSYQYKALATASEPHWWKQMPDDYRHRLQYYKAYAATLAREVPIAAHYFEAIGMHVDKSIQSVSDMYLANIYALFNFLSGHTETAEQLEKAIEKQLDVQHIQEMGIRYVNAINQARLYRMTGDIAQSFAYYEKAYTVIADQLSESDVVYYGMNMAKVYETDGNYKMALCYWIKSAAAWLAMAVPEGLAWRPYCALLGNPLAPVLAPVDCNQMADCFLQQLTRCVAKYLDTIDRRFETFGRLEVGELQEMVSNVLATDTSFDRKSVLAELMKLREVRDIRASKWRVLEAWVVAVIA